jgi:hypothetical protein
MSKRQISGDATIVAVKNQLSCDLVSEVAVLNLETGKQFLLDSVGAAVWRLISERRSLDDIRSSLLRKYDVEREQCQSDLLEWIQKLAAEGLIEVGDEAAGSR